MKENPRRSLWGVGAAAIYIGFVLFILSLVLYASVQDVQLVETGYYERGLDYQQRIDSRKLSRKLNPGLTIEHQYAEDQIVLSLLRDDANGAVGTIRMMRPSNARLDRRWNLSLDESGEQVVSIENMARGQWRLEIDWSLDSTNYLNETRIVIP
jgi:hypothetical protein